MYSAGSGWTVGGGRDVVSLGMVPGVQTTALANGLHVGLEEEASEGEFLVFDLGGYVV